MLNLATLLGLGLGVDYSLLMTSRFREELAARLTGRKPSEVPQEELRAAVSGAVEATVATAGRAVFFSGLTVLLGLIGMLLFEFMILRSVGLAGMVVVGAGGFGGADAAAGAALDPGSTTRRLRSPPRRCRHDRRGTLGRPGPSGHGPPGRRARPDAGLPAPPRRAVPARPLQRARRDDPACIACHRGPRSTCSSGSSGRASSHPSRWRSGRTDRRRHRRTSPRSTTGRAGSRQILASPGSRASSTSTRGSRSRSTSCSTAAPAVRRIAISRLQLAATTRGDLTAVTVFTPYGPNRDEARGARR